MFRLRVSVMAVALIAAVGMGLMFVDGASAQCGVNGTAQCGVPSVSAANQVLATQLATVPFGGATASAASAGCVNGSCGVQAAPQAQFFTFQSAPTVQAFQQGGPVVLSMYAQPGAASASASASTATATQAAVPATVLVAPTAAPIAAASTASVSSCGSGGCGRSAGILARALTPFRGAVTVSRSRSVVRNR